MWSPYNVKPRPRTFFEIHLQMNVCKKLNFGVIKSRRGRVVILTLQERKCSISKGSCQANIIALHSSILKWWFTCKIEFLISETIAKVAILFVISSFLRTIFFTEIEKLTCNWALVNVNGQSDSNFLAVTLSILNKNLFWLYNFKMVKEIEQTKF